MRLIKRKGLLYPVLIIVLASIGILGYTFEPDVEAFAADNELAAVIRDGVLEVNVPYDKDLALNRTLSLEVLDPNDKLAGKAATTVSQSETGPWRFDIRINKTLSAEDLAWYRLKIGERSKLVSLSEILHLPVIQFHGQRSYAAGSRASARIITADSKSGRPLRNSRIKLALVNGDTATTLYTGRTDDFGTAQVEFNLPGDNFGSRQLRITADTSLGPVAASQSIQIERRDRILLTTDKPLYQPGQTIHLRALALDMATRAAAVNQPLTLEVEDGKGNKVFKKRGRTDGFGIASADFELADEVNFGPYHVRAILGEDDNASKQEKVVTVDRYTLPKFKIEIEFDKSTDKSKVGYYSPGDKVDGRIVARYLFGKPLSNAEVKVKLMTFDVQSVEIGQASGKTDAEGRFSFSSKLPDFLAGTSTQQGSAPVSVAVEVRDSAEHTESKSRDILVSNTPILIMAVPESGKLLPRLENKIYVLTSYPDGTPAQTALNTEPVRGRIETDPSGVAEITLQPGSGPVDLKITATDKQGRSATKTVRIDSATQSDSLMLRTDRSVYRVGETLRLETFSTKSRGAVYVDIIKNGQTVLTRAIESNSGHGSLSVDLTPALFGAIEVRAYQITTAADPIMDRRLVYVDPADDLKVTVSTDNDCYKPGDQARLNFVVTDSAGRPVSAALGIEIVDEAVFALSEKQPGFEKVFLYLQKELLTPRYEVHQFSFDEILDLPEGEHQVARRERAAQVLLAAAGAESGRDVSADFGREVINAKRVQYASAYHQRVYQTVSSLATVMSAYYEKNPSSKEGFGRDLELLAASDRTGKAPRDPWGNLLVGEGALAGTGYSYLTLRSLGPDGKKLTTDDIVVQLFAEQTGSAANVPFAGKTSISRNSVASGRSMLAGVVRDKNGAPVEAVTIAARLRTTGRTVYAYTDRSGNFVISNLRPGVYHLSFQTRNGQIMSYQSFSLSSGDKGTFEVTLPDQNARSIRLAVYPLYTDREMPRRNMLRAKRADRDGVEGFVAVAGGAGGAPAAEPAPARGLVAGERKEVEQQGKDDAAAAGPRVRSFFPETLYTNPSLITDGQGRASIGVPMADSITTWRITSLASTTRGLLGSATGSIKVFQDFFVDLDLPVSITEADSVAVPVAVYNYLPNPQSVSLELRQDPWFTLEENSANKSIDVKPGEVTVAHFRIKASRIGEQQLLVTARLKGANAAQPGDAIARSINVLPNGEERAVVINDRLEGAAAREVVIPGDAIPDASKILVKLYPGPLSQAVEGLDSILRMPGGCFEQTSSSTYPNILVMDYLKASKKITPEIQAKADGYISLGYQRLVTFEVPGGGFSWFGQAPANKILTSYGLMEFSDMSRVHEVDPKLIERTQNWLAGQQQPDGSFQPDKYFINEGATNRYNNDVLRITAYIGWALASTGYKGEAVNKARQYVASHTTGKEDPYTLAVIANFAVDSGVDKGWIDSAINALAATVTETEKTAFWKQQGETPTSARNDSADLETTALAAQALLKSGQKSALAKKALDYLTEKKDSFGNWQTTQATILSLKAFLLSFTKGTGVDTAGAVEIAIDGNTVERLQVTRENNDLLRVVDLGAYTHSGVNKVALSFKGQGSMQYQVVGRYYVPWTRGPETARDPLSIDVSYDRTRLVQDELATAKVTITNNTPAKAKMIMVDLGIPPGFEPSSEDFAELVGTTREKSGGKLEKYTITAKQVILYFDGLNPRQRLAFSFRLRAKFPVRARTFSSRVYEYYNPTVESKTRPIEMIVSPK